MFISTYPYRICISSAVNGEHSLVVDYEKMNNILIDLEWDCGPSDIADYSTGGDCIDFDIDINGDTNIPRLVELIHEAMETYFKEV